MKKKSIAVIAATAVSVGLIAIVPLMAFAQVSANGTCGNVTTGAGGGISGIICTIYGIIKIAIPVLILGAVAYFIYGVIKFVIAGDAEEKSEGRTMMINGIIGFAVIIGLWGLVYVLLTTFGLNANTAAPTIPVFQ